MPKFESLPDPIIEVPAEIQGKQVYFNAANSADLGVRYTNDGSNVILEIDNVRKLKHYEAFDTEHRAVFDALPAGASFAVSGVGFGWWVIL